MKIRRLAIILLTVSALLASVACGSKKEETERNIVVGVCPGPYGDMFLEAIAPQLEEKGYQVELIEFSDYVQPNLVLGNKEIDVNMFQHTIYLDNFSKEHNLDLSVVTEIPTVGMGVYSNTVKNFDEIPTGAVVTIPNDPTNLARALRVLQAASLIKLDPNANPATVSEADVLENPKEVVFTPIEAAQIPRTLDSTDLAVINGNFAIGAGLDLADSIYNEVLSEGYVNVIAVRTEDMEKEFVLDIQHASTNDQFKSVIEDTSRQYHTFQKPDTY